MDKCSCKLKDNTENQKFTISRTNNKSSLKRRILRNWDMYIMILIPLVLLITFSYMPMMGLQIAFKKFSPSGGIWGSKWVGLYQFQKLFETSKFMYVFFNTLKLSIYLMLVEAPITAVFALLLNIVRNKFFKKSVQMITYMPHFISTVIMVGIMIQILNPRVGLYGNICNLIGIEPADVWLNPAAFKHLYVWSSVWQEIGWNSVIYLAALSSVDQTLYEATTMDGANRFKQVIHVDIPCILPTFIILFILRVGGLMSLGYEKVLLMQNSINLSASEIISTYSYKVGLQGTTDYSYGTAIGLFNSIINLVLMCGINAVSKRFTETSLW